MIPFKKMEELEADHLTPDKHKHKESYSEELHGNIHKQIHHNLKNKNIKI